MSGARPMHSARIVSVLGIVLAGCASTAIPSASGTGAALERGAMALVASDYRSTNVSLAGPRGDVLTRSLLSTGARPAGLSYALSGDVVLPSDALSLDQDLPLIDRYGTNVISFVAPVSGQLRAQLPVGTGFEANPQDFLQWDASTAYVSRLGVDPLPGDTSFDGGSDLLVIDPRTPRIVSRIAFADKASVPARPSAMTRHGDHVVVSLERLSEGFDRAADADLALVRGATATLDAVVPLPALRNCGKPVFSSTGLVAIACTGLFDAATARFETAGSAVVVGALDTTSFTVLDRWDASVLDVSPAGSVAWLNDASLAFTAYGHGDAGDAVYMLSRGVSTATLLHRTAKPFTLGALRCDDRLPTHCFAAIAAPSAIAEFAALDGVRAPSVTLRPTSDVTGLPLRGLALFLSTPAP